MFRTFVVPLDGSTLAERALPYAIRLATARNGRLVLVQAAMAPPPVTIDDSDWEVVQRNAIQESERYLQDIAWSISAELAVEIDVAYGHAADRILETTSRYAADAIVMTTHGRTGLPHLLQGSVTESVLANSTVPVFALYTPPDEPPPPPFPTESARLLVPQDGSRYDPAAVAAAVEMVRTRGEIVLLRVVEPPEYVKMDERGHVLAYIDQQEETERLRALAYLTRVARELRLGEAAIQLRLEVRFGEPVTGIALVAKETCPDLIVMATHGRTGIRRALSGSISGNVIRALRRPVLLVHPHGAEEREVEQQLQTSKSLVIY